MLTLKAKKRSREKKTDRLLEQGLLPAVLYGPKTKNQSLMIDGQEFLKTFEKVGEASLFNLKVEGEKKEHKVLVKDFQIHPLTDDFVHVDFYQPILTEKVETTVPLVFVGEAPAVKEKEGVLVKSISEVEISALPADLPSEIKVKVDGLKELSDVLCIRDLQVPDKVEVLKEPDEIVATVSAPKTAEELMEEMERKEEEELFVGEEVPIEEEEMEEEEAPAGPEEAEEQEGIEL